MYWADPLWIRLGVTAVHMGISRAEVVRLAVTKFIDEREKSSLDSKNVILG